MEDDAELADLVAIGLRQQDLAVDPASYGGVEVESPVENDRGTRFTLSFTR